MTAQIEKQVQARSITRLCHFTPSRNLVHIASDSIGILATKKLKEDERGVFTQTDLLRLDQQEACISCSIEYPNPWYFDKAKSNEPLFQDWVVLLIKSILPLAAWNSVLSSNASANHGREILDGTEIPCLHAESIVGAYGKRFHRQPRRLSCSPTSNETW